MTSEKGNLTSFRLANLNRKLKWTFSHSMFDKLYIIDENLVEDSYELMKELGDVLYKLRLGVKIDLL